MPTTFFCVNFDSSLQQIGGVFRQNFIKKVVGIKNTAKRILERLRIQTSSAFDFKANFLFFWRLYGLVFYLETIGVR